MGADIAGACGQLVVSKEKEASSVVVGDIEDGPFKKNESGKAKHVFSKKNQKQKAKDDSGGDKKNANDNLDKWIKPLAVATAASASLCIVSLAVIAMQRRKR